MKVSIDRLEEFTTLFLRRRRYRNVKAYTKLIEALLKALAKDGLLNPKLFKCDSADTYQGIFEPRCRPKCAACLKKWAESPHNWRNQPDDHRSRWTRTKEMRRKARSGEPFEDKGRSCI